MDSYDSSEEEYSSNNELSCVESDDENQMIGGLLQRSNIKDIDDLDYNGMLEKLKSNIYTTYGDYSFIANPTDFIFYKILEKEYNKIRDNTTIDITSDNREKYITSLGKDHIRQLYYKNDKNLKSYAIKKDLHDIIRKINIFEQKYLDPMNVIIDSVNEIFFTNVSQQQQQQQSEATLDIEGAAGQARAARAARTARTVFNAVRTLQKSTPYPLQETNIKSSHEELYTINNSPPTGNQQYVRVRSGNNPPPTMTLKQVQQN